MAAIPRPRPRRAGRVRLARQQRQQAVRAQRVVVVDIFVAERDPVDPLRDQLRQRVLDLSRMAEIREAARHPIQQGEPPIHFPQQHAAAVRREPAPVEAADHAAAAQGVKFELRGSTLRGHGTSLSFPCK